MGEDHQSRRQQRATHLHRDLQPAGQALRANLPHQQLGAGLQHLQPAPPAATGGREGGRAGRGTVWAAAGRGVCGTLAGRAARGARRPATAKQNVGPTRTTANNTHAAPERSLAMLKVVASKGSTVSISSFACRCGGTQAGQFEGGTAADWHLVLCVQSSVEEGATAAPAPPPTPSAAQPPGASPAPPAAAA